MSWSHQTHKFDELCLSESEPVHFASLVSMHTVHLLDYAAGNIRSLVNAIEKLGWQVEWIKSPDDVAKAEVRFNAGKDDLSS